MLSNIKNNQILFLDIETVPTVSKFSELNENMQDLWSKKSKYLRDENQTPEDVFQRAGIYAEFGKIVCISVGFIVEENETLNFRVKSFADDNEKKILDNFKNLIIKSYNKPNKYLCAHNGKEFDFPYIARRMLINGIEIPKILNLAGKKPWEIKHLDTLELWKFGDYKHYTSLALLTEIFNIPSPKNDIDGSMVADVYYKENDLQRIAKYCENDVIAIARLFLKYKNQDIFSDENIEIINN